MAAGSLAVRSPSLDMETAVSRLLALAATKRDARSPPTSGADDISIGAHLFKITDFPEPSPEWTEAHEALRSFADELAAVGGMELMVGVYDEAAERYGYRAVCGVSASWSGLHGWAH